jgi:hypothetical protein
MWNVFERKHEFKTDIQRLHNHQFSSTVDEEIGVALLVVQIGVDWRILLDLSFEAILLCFWFLVCFVFVLLLYFVLIFYLGLRSLFIFLCVFVLVVLNAYLSSHVAKLSSFDPSKLFSSVKDLCKDHLVEGGLSLPYKKESILIRFQNQVRSGESGKMVICEWALLVRT